MVDIRYVITCFKFGDGTAAAAPPPFRPGNPALCGSHPLVTPYYCRLGDLLCFVFICVLIVFFLLVILCILCVPSVLGYCWLRLLTCINRRPYNLYSYTVLVETLNHAQSINQIWWRSVQGFMGRLRVKFGIRHWLWRSSLNNHSHAIVWAYDKANGIYKIVAKRYLLPLLLQTQNKIRTTCRSRISCSYVLQTNLLERLFWSSNDHYRTFWGRRPSDTHHWPAA